MDKITRNTMRVISMFSSCVVVWGVFSWFSEPSRVQATTDELADLPPFLDVFMVQNPIQVDFRPVRWRGAVSSHHGMVFYRVANQRQSKTTRSEGKHTSPEIASDDRFPGLLVIPDRQPMGPGFHRAARELAEIGYLVLVVSTDPRRLEQARMESGTVLRERVFSELGSAARWLQNNKSVFPDRIGVVGWSSGGYWARQLANSMRFAACVVCQKVDSQNLPVVSNPFAVPTLSLISGIQEKEAQSEVHFKTSIGFPMSRIIFPEAQAGFMFPESGERYHFESSEKAWFEMYEFLDEHVEDSHHSRVMAEHISKQSDPLRYATLVDLMQAVNSPSGVRGLIGMALKEHPDRINWKQVRAQAVLLVEVASLLPGYTPPRGTRADWLTQIQAYRAEAELLVRSTRFSDTVSAQHAFQQLSRRCGVCHAQHR